MLFLPEESRPLSRREKATENSLECDVQGAIAERRQPPTRVPCITGQCTDVNGNIAPGGGSYWQRDRQKHFPESILLSTLNECLNQRVRSRFLTTLPPPRTVLR